MSELHDQIGRWIDDWRARLGLQDWEIRFAVKRERDMARESSRACVQHWLVKRAALIEFLDPADYPADPTFPIDVELDVIHELLHLHFAAFEYGEGDEPTRIAQEQAIHAISKALVAVKRAS